MFLITGVSSTCQVTHGNTGLDDLVLFMQAWTHPMQSQGGGQAHSALRTHFSLCQLNLLPGNSVTLLGNTLVS